MPGNVGSVVRFKNRVSMYGRGWDERWGDSFIKTMHTLHVAQNIVLKFSFGPYAQCWCECVYPCYTPSNAEATFDLGVVDREWALCMRHQISLPPTIWVIDNLCTAGLAACCLLKKITWPILPQATSRNPRRTYHLGTSMLCLWGCGSRGCISLFRPTLDSTHWVLSDGYPCARVSIVFSGVLHHFVLDELATSSKGDIYGHQFLLSPTRRISDSLRNPWIFIR